MNTSGGSSRLSWWIGVAIVAAVIVIFFVFVFQGGSCSDAAPGQGDSICTSGPAIGSTAAGGITILGIVVIIFSVARAVKIGRHRGTTKR